MFEDRRVWLGQVPLVMRPGMGNIAERFPAPPADAKAPANGCLFMGGRSIMDQGTVNARIKEAQALGYTDIQELDVPPCDPVKDYFHCTIVGGNPPSKYVWACLPKGAAPAGGPGTTPSQTPTSSPAPTPGAPPPAPPSAFPTTAVLAVGGAAAAGLVAVLAL